MINDDINDYLPSILNPRGIKKQHGDLSLTQNSIVSRCSLSLKRKNGVPNIKKSLHKPHLANKENAHNINNLPRETPNAKNVDKDKSNQGGNLDLPTTLQLHPVCPLEKEFRGHELPNQNNVQNKNNIIESSIGLSAVEDLITDKQNIESCPVSFEELEVQKKDVQDRNNNESLVALSSATELNEINVLDNSTSTIEYELTEKPVISVSFGVTNCKALHVSTNTSNIKNIVVTRKDCGMDVDCDVIECSDISTENDQNEVTQTLGQNTPKKSAVAVSLEIKKKKSTEETVTENSKVLILNTDAIERLSHVIVQPPNYKLVKRQISDSSKFKNKGKRKRESVRDGKTVRGDNLKQKRIDCYFGTNTEVLKGTVESVKNEAVARGDDEEMSKNLGVADAVKCDRGRSASKSRRESTLSPRTRVAPRNEHVKNSTSDARGTPKLRHDSANSAPSPRKNLDSTPFTLPTKSTSNKASIYPKNIPHYKIVAGTHFAVDAFSYGDVPNVKHYFLTHFHSDHYSGLKKTFNKVLFCTKITADLCISRLGVNPKCLHIMGFDETITIDGIEVTAVDANHCPGAMMLVFTLPSGKTLLHTGDFRASPNMESYPVFWNKDIHTIYLDSTYCNPRYDFPTQDQSLEMALYHLRQKKMSLEKTGKKFSSVLIVCGTYTIGKEKFFLGMARRVGCSVWACPEKDKVLQAVEGRSFGTASPAACQLHVVPMRDLTHEKLRSYLESLQGAFSEVVAFKPSGWENGKNSTLEKDLVTIHGIPYSEHSSFSEMIRFVKFLNPKQVVPTVDISGGIKAVQKFFPCPLVHKEGSAAQSKVTDYFSIQNRQQLPAGVT